MPSKFMIFEMLITILNGHTYISTLAILAFVLAKYSLLIKHLLNVPT